MIILHFDYSKHWIGLDNEDCLERSEQGDFESSDGGFSTAFVDKARVVQHFAGTLELGFIV